ncbi:Na+:solute symporter, partial [bacterium]|nr:Na+:solute symporter [bacterium]
MGYEFIPVNALDWGIIIGFLVFTLVVGIIVSKKAGESSEDFFLSGRSMPWWLLGFSMVATTFSTDTPNLVTDMVRQGGVAQNWSWWAFLMTGMLTTFIYSKLWRRSGVVTDLGFYELRYSGKSAAFLRGFRAVYLGFLFNIIVMATVSMAAIKIGGVMLGLKPWETVIYAAAITTIFSVLGGLKSVLITDCLLFIVAMVGSVAAAVVSINRAGGLDTVLNNPLVQSKMDILPSFDIYTPGVGFNKEALNLLITLLLMPVLVQWWSAWYPGAEPGGGGFVAQRMLAAKNERHAAGATLFFNFLHYAIRTWPWLVVALASLVVFPDLESMRQAFPAVT